MCHIIDIDNHSLYCYPYFFTKLICPQKREKEIDIDSQSLYCYPYFFYKTNTPTRRRESPAFKNLFLPTKICYKSRAAVFKAIIVSKCIIVSEQVSNK